MGGSDRPSGPCSTPSTGCPAGCTSRCCTPSTWRRWRLAAALVLVVPCKLGLEQVAKLLVQRQRPGTTVPDAILRGVPHGGLSFTSGHAIITFAIAGLLVLVLPRRWGLLAIVLA